MHSDGEHIYIYFKQTKIVVYYKRIVNTVINFLNRTRLKHKKQNLSTLPLQSRQIGICFNEVFAQ